VLSADSEQGEVHGSGRSIPAFHLLDALESMPELFTRFGGHRQAAGLSMSREHVGEFRERLNAYAAGHLTEEDFRPVREFDARLDFDEITDQTAADILALAPFGFGNPAPLFAVEDVEVAEAPVVFKEKHVRLKLRQGGRSILVKAWNFAARVEELAPGALVDVAVSFEDDPYAASRGFPGWSLVLHDVR